MKTDKVKREKKENYSSGALWLMLENFFSSLINQAEKKIQAGAEEAGFFLKKKAAAGILFFFGGGFSLVGVALAMEKVLAFWGMTGWGWLLTGGICLLLAGLVNNLKK